LLAKSHKVLPLQVKTQFHFPLRRRFHILATGIWLASILTAAAGSAETASQNFHTTDVPNNARLVAQATNHLGSWIWAAQTWDKQTVHLWKSFEVPSGAKVSRGVLWIAVDNGYQLYLDGQEIGQGSDWRWLTQCDATLLLKPGKHVLAVSAFNDALAAGLMFGLHIEFTDGHTLNIVSDSSWRVAPNTFNDWINQRSARPDWPAATVVGTIDQTPWKPWPIGVITGPQVHPVIVRFWQTGRFQIVLLASCAIAVLVCLWLLAQLAMQFKAQRLLHLQRARIARDIHDDLGARLTQLVLQGELIQSELPSESATRAQIDQICESARELANAMDEVVWAVSSRRDTLRDFAAFACRYAQVFLRNTPVRCRLDIEPDLPSSPFELHIRRNLLLAVKEAISNAAKYSGASELVLRIHRHDAGVRVVVEDNGRGFDMAQVTPERNGLINMAQRMHEVGGRFAVNSMRSAGCRVEFTLPLTHVRRRPHWFSRFLGGPIQSAELEQPPTSIEPVQQPAESQP
jgi:signal transduction histidine kinase